MRGKMRSWCLVGTHSRPPTDPGTGIPGPRGDASLPGFFSQPYLANDTQYDGRQPQ